MERVQLPARGELAMRWVLTSDGLRMFWSKQTFEVALAPVDAIEEARPESEQAA
jgi:hypothetical protein